MYNCPKCNKPGGILLFTSIGLCERCISSAQTENTILPENFVMYPAESGKAEQAECLPIPKDSYMFQGGPLILGSGTKSAFMICVTESGKRPLKAKYGSHSPAKCWFALPYKIATDVINPNGASWTTGIQYYIL